MAKAKSQTFHRTILLVLILVFWVSLETMAKGETFASGRSDKRGATYNEPLTEAGDGTYKRMITTVPTQAPRVQPTDPGYIYVIKMVGAGTDQPPKYVKVGFAVNPKQRMSNLVAGNPFTLAFVATWKVKNMLGAETLAHTALEGVNLKLTNLRERTEWFKLPSEEGLEGLVSLVQKSIKPYLDLDQTGTIIPSSWVY